MTKKLLDVALIEPAVLEEAGQERDLANQMLGQIQVSMAFSKLTTVVSLQKLKQVKEGKLYRSVAGQKAINRMGVKITDVGTWAGFCQALGVSASKVDEDLSNLRAFGEEAMDQLTNMGVGYRELRELRRLPDDEKLALTELAQSGDKDALADFAESLMVRHAKQKQVLQEQIEDLQASHTDLSVERDTAQTERDDLAKRLRRRDLDGADARVPLVVADQRLEIAALLHKAQLALRALHPLGVEIVNLRGHDEASEWVEPSLRLALAGLLATREELDGVLGKYAQALDDRRTLMQPADALSFMDEDEVRAVAAEFAQQIALHGHEAALRQHEREAAHPKGKGRPKAAPELPAAAAKGRKA